EIGDQKPYDHQCRDDRNGVQKQVVGGVNRITHGMINACKIDECPNRGKNQQGEGEQIQYRFSVVARNLGMNSYVICHGCLKINVQTFFEYCAVCPDIKHRLFGKAKHSGQQVVRKRLYGGVQLAGGRVEKSSNRSQFVFNVRNFGLQVHKILVRFQIRISFHLDRKST